MLVSLKLPDVSCCKKKLTDVVYKYKIGGRLGTGEDTMQIPSTLDYNYVLCFVFQHIYLDLIMMMQDPILDFCWKLKAVKFTANSARM